MGRLALDPRKRPQRFLAKQGNIAWASGSTNKIDVSQTDYLTSLDLISVQTVTETTTAPSGTTSGAGAYAPLALVSVAVNGGRTPFSMPGYHANVYNQIWNHDYVDSLATNPIVTNATNNWKNHLRVPLTVDPIAEKGSWYVGDTTLDLQCKVLGNTQANIWQTQATATIGGGWDVYSEKFSAPAPDEPNGWLDEISFYKDCERQVSNQQLANGSTTINIGTDQDIVRLFMVFYTGSEVGSGVTFAPADGLYTNMSLIVNDKFRIVDTLTEDKVRFEMLETYTRLLPAGTAVLDFMRLTPPTRRDILPTDPDSTKKLTLSITSNSSSNFVDVMVEAVVDSQFAEKWAKSARQKSGSK